MNRRTALRSMISTVAAVGLAGCAGVQLPTPFGRTGGDGAPLSQAVWAKLRSTPDISLGLTRVEVFTQGEDADVIVLKGSVISDDVRFNIERVAGTVEGVRSVQSILFVQTDG